MESDKPIDLLASRVWSGSKWHYPHIEAMLSDIERLRAELAAMRQERDEAREEICELVAESVETITGFTTTAKQIAAQRGWDCFKEGGGA